ncbi:MAG: hypothetical protein V7723_10825 [Sneathiella sp.]
MIATDVIVAGYYVFIEIDKRIANQARSQADKVKWACGGGFCQKADH